MKQETNNINKIETNKVSKISSLLSAVFLTFISIFIFGLGIVWLFQMIGINETLRGVAASQIAIALLALAFFRFKIADLVKTISFKLNIKSILFIILSVVAIFLVNISIGTIIEVFNLNAGKLDEYTSGTTGSYITGNMLLMAMPIIVAPIFEELAFRAGLKKALVDNSKWKPYQYVIISSILFALLHWQPGTFTIVPMLVTGFMGVAHSIIYLKTNNIIVPIASHMIYNIIIMYLAFATL